MATRDVIFNFKINADGAEAGARKFDSATKQVGASGDKVKSKADGLGSTFTKLGGVMAGVFSIAKVVQFGKASVAAFGKFETAAQSLSAITGLVGDDLEDLKSRATELGKEAGITGAEVLKSFELVGSAKPELLGSADALAGVTEQAIKLSQASGLDLPTAIDSLANTLNQFDEGAEGAAATVDQLAAASQAGAVAIPDLAQSLKVAGSTANASKVPLNEALAAIELFGETGVKGAEGGTEFRNFLLKAQNAGIGFRDGVFSMSAAIEDLEKKQLNVTEANKIFGEGATRIALALGNGRDRFTELTTAINAQGVAAQQAAKNTDTYEFAQKKLVASVDALMVQVGQALAPTIKALAEFLTEATNRSGEFFERFEKYGKLAAAIGQAIDTLAEKLGFQADQIDKVGLAFDILESGIRHVMNPLSIMSDAVGWINDQLGDLVENGLRKLGASESFVQTVASAFDSLGEIVRGLLNPIGGLIDGLEELGVIERSAANLTEELGKAFSGNMEQFKPFSREIEAFGRITGASAKQIKEFADAGGITADELQRIQAQLAAGNLSLEEQNALFNSVVQRFKEYNGEGAGVADITNQIADAITGSGGTSDSISAYEEKLKKLKQSLKDVSIGSAEYLRITKEIEDTQATLTDKVNQAAFAIEKLGASISDVSPKSFEAIPGAASGIGQRTGEDIARTLGDTMGDTLENEAGPKIGQFTDDIANGALSVINAVNDRVLSDQLNALETAKEKQLAAAGDNADRRAAIEAEFDKKRAQIERQAAIRAKAIALTQAAINTALAVTAGLASPAVPPFPSAIAAGIAGAAQIAVIAAQPLAEGTPYLTGGQQGRDSIPAMLMPGEAVIPTKKNRAYMPTVQAIFGGFPPDLLNAFVQSGGKLAMNFSNSSSSSLDDSRIVDKLTSIDRNLRKGRRGTSYRNKRR